MRTLLLCVAAFVPAFGQAPLTNPSAPGSVQPNWAMAADGSALFSWVEPAKDVYNLRYAVLRGSTWSEARTIATGRNVWRHPAEVPQMVVLSDGTLLTSWTEKGKGSSDAEDLYVSSSKDGLKWTVPVMAHHDHHPVQHGLASIVASGPSEASILWLQALEGEDGPVSLMRTIVGADGKEIREEELDKDVCSCCPTSVVKTAKGLLTAYRDHTSKDIRDIAVLRFENAKWSASKILNADNWQIDACPVNAASAAAKDNRVAIAWFTEAGDKPRVQLAFSNDAGATFAKPVLLSTGSAVGYVSTALDDDGGALISWIEQGAKSARVLFRTVSPAGVAGPVIQIAEGGRQGLGYPRILHNAAGTFIVWGKPDSKLQTASIKK